MVNSNIAIICLLPFSGGMELDAIKLANVLVGDVNTVPVSRQGCLIGNYYRDNVAGSEVLQETIHFCAGLDSPRRS
jgi:hypothetical protein